MLVWLSTISILGIGASIAAAIFLGAKKIAVAGIGGFGSILASAIVVNAARPFLIWLALALAGILVIAGIVMLRKYILGFEAAVAFGCDMSKADTEVEAQRVRDVHSHNQIITGVKTLIDKTIEKVKP